MTVAWMLVEAGVALYAARGAESVALLAFGSDSVVEMLSAIVVLLQFTSAVRIPERTASRAAGILLLVLAAVVAVIAVGALAMGWHAETSVAGMAITIAALAAMPVLAWLKRSEARRCGNAALAADAVQSATCAWLAFATLAGLVLNAAFHVPWVDSAAGLIAVPLLVKEGRSAWRGQGCGCP
ncbi:MAG TPA: cation transporter [Acidobacteriaceae bacterium]|nr:cation transporter [Acidobacteriaceae bacterium]